jgi:hypothetical protein
VDGVAPPPVSALRWRNPHPGRYDIDVGHVEHPFILTLAEASAPGWQLRGLPHGSHAEHITVNGYANGWRIESRGNLRLTAEYVPARWSREAMLLSALAAAAAVLITLYRRNPWRPRRAPRPRRSGIAVRRSERPSTLTVAEADAMSWQLRGVPYGLHSEHSAANEYAKGWRR